MTVHHLDFIILEILTVDWVRRSWVHHHTKFSQNRSNGCGDTGFFDYLKMVAIRHLGFLGHILEPPTKRSSIRISLESI